MIWSKFNPELRRSLVAAVVFGLLMFNAVFIVMPRMPRVKFRHKERVQAHIQYSKHPSPATEAAMRAENRLLMLRELAILVAVNSTGAGLIYLLWPKRERRVDAAPLQ